MFIYIHASSSVFIFRVRIRQRSLRFQRSNQVALMRKTDQKKNDINNGAKTKRQTKGLTTRIPLKSVGEFRRFRRVSSP